MESGIDNEREDPDVVAGVRSGSEAAFTALVERHRRELRVHCYRMVGNLDDAEESRKLWIYC